jgi:AcrR family transcriptional regulator
VAIKVLANVADQSEADKRHVEEARMADHVLACGLPVATLRPLAAAAGTSDRMLIYRYGSKDALMARLLDVLADRLTALLDAAPAPDGRTADTLAADMAARMTHPTIAPYRAVWLELAATAARGNPAAEAATSRILVHFATWLAKHLPNGSESAPADAARVLAMIEGAVVISVAGDAGLTLLKQAFVQPETHVTRTGTSHKHDPVV